MIIDLIVSIKKRFLSSVHITLMVKNILSTSAFVPGIAKAYSTIADMLVVSMYEL